MAALCGQSLGPSVGSIAALCGPWCESTGEIDGTYLCSSAEELEKRGSPSGAPLPQTHELTSSLPFLPSAFAHSCRTEGQHASRPNWVSSPLPLCLGPTSQPTLCRRSVQLLSGEEIRKSEPSSLCVIVHANTIRRLKTETATTAIIHEQSGVAE